MTSTKGRGGSRRGAGRKRYRKALPWPEGFDLKMKENADAFLIHYIQEFWSQNPLDARAGGCLNNALRLYYDAQGWISKAPLQIIQAQVMQPGTIAEADLADLLSELPEDERRKLWEKAKERRLRHAVSRPSQS